MKLADTLFYFVPVMIGAACLVATIAFGSVDTQSGASRQSVAPSVESIVYFPAQYTLDAPNPVNEHIQAF